MCSGVGGVRSSVSICFMQDLLIEFFPNCVSGNVGILGDINMYSVKDSLRVSFWNCSNCVYLKIHRGILKALKNAVGLPWWRSG